MSIGENDQEMASCETAEAVTTADNAECWTCKIKLSSKEALVLHIQEVHKIEVEDQTILDESAFHNLDSSLESNQAANILVEPEASNDKNNEARGKSKEQSNIKETSDAVQGDAEVNFPGIDGQDTQEIQRQSKESDVNVPQTSATATNSNTSNVCEPAETEVLLDQWQQNSSSMPSQNISLFVDENDESALLDMPSTNSEPDHTPVSTLDSRLPNSSHSHNTGNEYPVESLAQPESTDDIFVSPDDIQSISAVVIQPDSTEVLLRTVALSHIKNLSAFQQTEDYTDIASNYQTQLPANTDDHTSILTNCQMQSPPTTEDNTSCSSNYQTPSITTTDDNIPSCSNYQTQSTTLTANKAISAPTTQAECISMQASSTVSTNNRDLTAVTNSTAHNSVSTSHRDLETSIVSQNSPSSAFLPSHNTIGQTNVNVSETLSNVSVAPPGVFIPSQNANLNQLISSFPSVISITPSCLSISKDSVKGLASQIKHAVAQVQSPIVSLIEANVQQQTTAKGVSVVQNEIYMDNIENQLPDQDQETQQTVDIDQQSQQQNANDLHNSDNTNTDVKPPIFLVDNNVGITNRNNNNIMNRQQQQADVVVISSDEEEDYSVDDIGNSQPNTLSPGSNIKCKGRPPNSVRQGQKKKKITQFRHFILDKFYKQNQNPSKRDIKELSGRSQLHFDQVLNWFSERKNEDRISSNENVLSNFYQRKQFPSLLERNSLAKALGVSVQMVRQWFLKKRSETRKIRTVVSFEQSGKLFEFFKHTPFPSSEEYVELSQDVNISLKTVKTWFTIKRQEHYYTKTERISPQRAQAIKDFLKREPHPSDDDLFELAKNLRMTLSRVRVFIRKQGLLKKKAMGDFDGDEDDNEEISTENINDGFTEMGPSISRVVSYSFSASAENEPTITNEDASHLESNSSASTASAGHYSGNTISDSNIAASKYRLSASQLVELIDHFDMNSNPSLSDMKQIARIVKAPSNTVIQWFSEKFQNFRNNTSSDLTNTLQPNEIGENNEKKNKLTIKSEINKDKKKKITSSYIHRQLLEHFKQNANPGVEEMSRIAHSLSLTFVEVLSFFCDNRDGSSKTCKRGKSTTKATEITIEMNEKLKVFYDFKKNPSYYELKELSDWLNIHMEYLKIWFHYKRQGEQETSNENRNTGSVDIDPELPDNESETTDSASEQDNASQDASYSQFSADAVSKNSSVILKIKGVNTKNPRVCVLSSCGIPPEIKANVEFYVKNINSNPTSSEIDELSQRWKIKPKMLTMLFENENKKLTETKKSNDSGDNPLNIKITSVVSQKRAQRSSDAEKSNQNNFKSTTNVWLEKLKNKLPDKDVNDQAQTSNSSTTPSDQNRNFNDLSSQGFTARGLLDCLIHGILNDDPDQQIAQNCHKSASENASSGSGIRRLSSVNDGSQESVNGTQNSAEVITLEQYQAIMTQLNHTKTPSVADIAIVAMKLGLSVNLVNDCVSKTKHLYDQISTSQTLGQESNSVESVKCPPTANNKGQQKTRKRKSNNANQETTFLSISPGHSKSLENFFLSSEPQNVDEWATCCTMTRGEVFTAWGSFRQNVNQVISGFDPYFSKDGLSTEQRKRLSMNFKSDQMPNKEKVEKIVSDVGLTASLVQSWYSITRQKFYQCCLSMGGQSIVNMFEKYFEVLQQSKHQLKDSKGVKQLKTREPQTSQTFSQASVTISQAGQSHSQPGQTFTQARAPINSGIQIHGIQNQPRNLNMQNSSNVIQSNSSNVIQSNSSQTDTMINSRNLTFLQGNFGGNNSSVANTNFQTSQSNPTQHATGNLNARNIQGPNLNRQYIQGQNQLNNRQMSNTLYTTTASGNNMQNMHVQGSSQLNTVPSNQHLPKINMQQSGNIDYLQYPALHSMLTQSRDHSIQSITPINTIQPHNQNAFLPESSTQNAYDDGNSSLNQLERFKQQVNSNAMNVLSLEEVKMLENFYKANPNPSMDEAERIATGLGKPITVIVQWYKDRRIKAVRETTLHASALNSSIISQTNIPLPPSTPQHQPTTSTFIPRAGPVINIKFENPFLNDGYGQQPTTDAQNLNLNISNLQSASNNNSFFPGNNMAGTSASFQGHEMPSGYRSSDYSGGSNKIGSNVMQSPDSTTRPAKRDSRVFSGKAWHYSVNENCIIIDDL